MIKDFFVRNEISLYFFIKTLSFVAFILVLLLSVALLTVWERKILGLIQRRKGPNVVGYCGVLQPFSDGIKLLLKECIIPSRANKYLFIFAPVLAMTISFMLWSVLPVGVYIAEPEEVYAFWDYDSAPIEDYNFPVVYNGEFLEGVYSEPSIKTTFELFMDSFVESDKDSIYLGSLLNTDVSLLMVLALLSLNTYPVILGGWASNSKYAFLGSLRASAQMISYEIAMSLTLLPVCVLSGSANLNDVIEVQSTMWNIFVLPVSFVLFFICVLAETYRTPFDFTEAEGELVSGFNVEYSSMGFALFFLAEYLNIIFMCAFMSVLFFGGLRVWVVLLLLFFIILIRGTLPRYRYDQLMRLGWRIIMPLSVLYLILVSFVFFFFF